MAFIQRRHIIVYIVLFVTLYSFPLHSQNVTETAAIYSGLKNQVDQIYKLDDLLVNGHLYRPLNPNALGSPYFLNDKLWKNSTLFIKGRIFKNQEIMYDIEHDQLIAKIQFPDDMPKNIILDEKFVDSLFIENHFFINLACFTNMTEGGIYEQVYAGDFRGLIKHRITYKPIITYSSPNGYYDKPEATLYIFYKGKLNRISNKNMLMKYFSGNEKAISKYMRTNHIRLKTASQLQLFNLFNFCDDL